MKNLVALVLCLALISCVGSPAPAQYQFDNSRSFDASMGDVWEAIIEFFAANNLPISMIERDSGLIVLDDLRFSSDEEFNQYADCGVAAGDMGNLRQDSGIGNMNLFIRERSTGNAEVSVNTRFHLLREVQTNMYLSKWFECVSTGALESVIFDRIADSIYLPTADF